MGDRASTMAKLALLILVLGWRRSYRRPAPGHRAATSGSAIWPSCLPRTRRCRSGVHSWAGLPSGAGYRVLIINHALNVPGLLKAFGHPDGIRVALDDFESLFVIVPRPEGPPLVIFLRL